MTVDEYGKSVKEKRESLGLSQESFGKALNIAPQTISKIEGGKRNPSITTQLKLWKEYGITPMKEIKKNTLSERVKIKRIESGLTQKELANKIGVSSITISRIEQGKKNPNPFNVICMAIALKTTPDYLICMEDNGDAGSNS